MSTGRFSARGIWRALGPGLVTSADDDDPSGMTLPFMAAIQIISALTLLIWSSARN
jgi:hypothetical protein